MSADVELMALLQEEGQRETVQRERLTPERLRETSTLRLIYSLLALLERRDQGLSAHAHAVGDLATAIAHGIGAQTGIQDWHGSLIARHWKGSGP